MRQWENMTKEPDATFYEVFFLLSSTNSIKLPPWCFSSAVPLHYMSDALATAMQQEEDVPATIAAPELEGSQAPDPSDSPVHQTETLPLPVPPLLDIPFVGTPLVGCPFAGFIAGPTQKKVDCSSSGSPGNHHDKRSHVVSQEVKAKSEHSSTQDKQDMPTLASEVRPSSEPQGQEPTNAPSSPTKATADPYDCTVGKASRSIRDKDSESRANHSGTSSDSNVFRENVADSDMESASGDCISCLDTDEVTIRTPYKKCRKRVQASCSLDKGSLWSVAQLKWISDSHQDVWGHDQEVIRTEPDHTLEEDCNFFDMHKMRVKMDQLLHISEATNSKVYTHELEAEAHGQMKALVLSLKQYYTHYYQLYEKGTTRAMVGLQGLHSGDAFRCSNISSSVGLKSFFPWCFKLGGKH